MTSAANITQALAQAHRLLAKDPALAEKQAREILRVVPAQPEAQLLLSISLKSQGKFSSALVILEPLARAQPHSPAVWSELGLALADAGRTTDAVAALLHSVRIAPANPEAWRVLGDQFTLLGDSKAADGAYARHIQTSANNPRLVEAAQAMAANKLAHAEATLRNVLREHPTDVAAMRMLAEVGARLNRFDDAEALLSRALELSPSFVEARHNYATVLYRHNKSPEAIAEVDTLLARDPRNAAYRSLKAAALGRIGEYEKAIASYEDVLGDFPQQPKAWMSYGHALKTVGRTDDSIAAYRRSIALMPSLGEAYWSLANLKTYRFSGDDIATMRTQLARSDLSADDRLHLHFSLGKALEDAADFRGAFEHYETGNALRKGKIPYEAHTITAQVRRMKSLFTKAFLESRIGSGSSAPDPIFIVGLTRSGSTLLEQILSSHSAVEGTMELPDIIAMTRRIGGMTRKSDAYPEALAEMQPEELRALGDEYISRTRIQRKLGTPFFIDKMPNNWLHAGFIHLILPNARIIDARRHPLGCCFSNFKQHFARGQSWTYSLDDLGRYYADYVELMAHFDAVLPGRVHRIFYERMVADPETEVRTLLDYCGLPFEPACLKFYETDRAVRTASSEQVRQPIYSDSVEQWVRFEPWLGPLKAALGPVLEKYPDVPEF